jgi:hypothetical protein
MKVIEFIRLTQEHEGRTLLFMYAWEICFHTGTRPLCDLLDVCKFSGKEEHDFTEL